MKNRVVRVQEMFEAGQELAYDLCFQKLATLPDPEELASQGAPPEIVQELSESKHFVLQNQRPRQFVIEKINGSVATRIKMDFTSKTGGTLVTQSFSIHPQTFLARLLTAIPRRRLDGARPAMQEQLRYLKAQCEDRQFLLEAHAPSQEQQLRRQGDALLAGAAYFEILTNAQTSEDISHDLYQILYESARVHFTLASGERPEHENIRGMIEDEVLPEFERRLEAGDADSLSFFVEAFPFYIAWANRLLAVTKEGIMSLDAIARGDREVMGRLALEHFAPPGQEELQRTREKMDDLEPEQLLYLFAGWKQQRQDSQPSSQVANSGSPSVDRAAKTNEPEPREQSVENHLKVAKSEGKMDKQSSYSKTIEVLAPAEEVRRILKSTLPAELCATIEFSEARPPSRHPFAGTIRGEPEILITILTFAAGSLASGAFYDLFHLALDELEEHLGGDRVRSQDLAATRDEDESDESKDVDNLKGYRYL